VWGNTIPFCALFIQKELGARPFPMQSTGRFLISLLEKTRENKDGSFQKTKHLPIPSSSI
jgi:hypothetical protein